MIVELQRFIEFKPGWFTEHKLVGKDWVRGKEAEKTLANLKLEPFTVNTEYITWLKRTDLCAPLDFCEIGTVDRHGPFVVYATYEDMRQKMKGGVSYDPRYEESIKYREWLAMLRQRHPE